MSSIYVCKGTDTNTPHIALVDVASGDTIGEFNIGGDVKNLQAVRIDRTGVLYSADIGDPQRNRTDICLWRTDSPGPGDHTTIPSTRLGISYPFGPTDARALAVHPNGTAYIITYESGAGRLLRLPTPLSGNNVAVNMNKTMPAYVTDATFTHDGRWLLIRAEGSRDTIVYNATTFVKDGTLTSPQQAISTGGSITMEHNVDCFFVVGSGRFAPIFRICLPTKYKEPPPTPPPPPPPTDPCNAATLTPDEVLPSINARQWKLTLPTPLNCSNNADDITANQLAGGYEHPSFYFVACNPKAVVFRAPVNGSRTSERTAFPRSELREMRANGSDEASWTLGSGQHVLDITQAVTVLPQRDEVRRVVLGQIHDANDDVCVISCDAHSPSQKTGLTLWASLNDEHNYRLIANDYVLGRYFRVRMVTTGNGVIILYDDFRGAGLRNPILQRYNERQINTGSRSGCYFKAGCYTQATACPRKSGQEGTGYGEVRIKSLAVQHIS